MLKGEVDFSSDTSKVYKIALYTSSADLDAATTTYTTTGEASGTGYTAGGNTLVIVAPVLSGTTAFVDFDNTIWSTTTITSRGALIYEANGTTNPSVAVLDFGENKTSTAGNFEIQFPAADATNAIVRVV